jgi:hypothetical protein
LFAVNLFVSATGVYQMKRLHDAGLLFGGSPPAAPAAPAEPEAAK